MRLCEVKYRYLQSLCELQNRTDRYLSIQSCVTVVCVTVVMR